MTVAGCPTSGTIILVASNLGLLLVEYWMGKKRPLGQGSLVSFVWTAATLTLLTVGILIAWRRRK